MQPIKRIENVNFNDVGIQPVAVIQAKKTAINKEGSSKAAFRKFVSENGVPRNEVFNVNIKNEYIELGDSIFKANGISDVRDINVDAKTGKATFYVNYGEVVSGGGVSITCNSLNEATIYMDKIIKHFEDRANFNYIKLGKGNQQLIVNLNDVDSAKMVSSNVIEVSVRVINNCYPTQPYVWNFQVNNCGMDEFKRLKDAMNSIKRSYSKC